MTPTTAAETGGSRPPPAPNGVGGSHPPPAPDGSHLPPAEAPVARALRILSGDIRPDDYLAVPADIQADHDREMNRLLVEEGVAVAPLTYARILCENTLREVYPCRTVIRKVTERGTLVIAVGDEVGDVRQAIIGDWPEGYVIVFAD